MSDRVSKLSRRFQRDEEEKTSKGGAAVEGKTQEPDRKRDRHSFYLDTELVEEMHLKYRQAYARVIQADPHMDIAKSEFLEALMGYGLDNFDQVMKRLVQAKRASS